jgi:DnaK suppressor protein
MSPTKKVATAPGPEAPAKAAAPAKAKAEPAKKAVPDKGPAKPVAGKPPKAATAEKAAPVKAPPVKAAPVKAAPTGSRAVPAKKAAPAPAAPPAKKLPGPYAADTKFLDEQRQLLIEERAVYLEQAHDLKAEADSLAQEREPGDVQFDEESGEGGTVTVDRERDLALSAQALLAVEEIDDAMVRIDNRTYGACERCHQPIPKPRLRALPYARLCVACKSGGLSRR